MKLNKLQIAILVLALIFTAFLVYTPHFVYQYPSHADEWRHITEARMINEGEFTLDATSIEVGFNFFLAGLYSITDIVQFYKFLPVFFALVAALVLFFTVYDLTKNYRIAIFSMIFFASIGSNANIGGVWYAIPLSFSIALIYLFFWLFSSGVEKEDIRKFVYSFVVFLILIFIHPVSATFMIPIIVIYSGIKYKFFLKNWKICLIWIIVPVIGLLFYKFVYDGSFLEAIMFRRGWDNVEDMGLKLSWGYSLIAFLAALLGVIYAYKKKYSLNLIWFIVTGFSLLIYIFMGFSLFAPHLRMFYYFVLSLPILSAFGMHYGAEKIGGLVKGNFRKYAVAVFFILIFILTFVSYYSVDPGVRVYRLIDEDDYNAMKFLEEYDDSDSIVIASAEISTTMYAISGHKTIGTIYFYGGREKNDKFFESDCSEQENMIEKEKAEYVLSKEPIECGWDVIYQEKDIVYKVG